MFPGAESNRWPYVENEHKQGEQKHQTQALRTTLFYIPIHIQKMMAKYIPEYIVIPNVGVQQKKREACLSFFCNYGWWHVDASQCTAARASFGRCCSLCRQIMGLISS